MTDKVLIDALYEGVCEYLKAFKGEDIEDARQGVGRSFEGMETIEDAFGRLFFPYHIDEYVFGAIKISMNRIGISDEIISELSEIFAREYIKIAVKNEEKHHKRIIEDVPNRIVGHLSNAIGNLRKIQNEVYLDDDYEKYLDDVNEIEVMIVMLTGKIRKD